MPGLMEIAIIGGILLLLLSPRLLQRRARNLGETLRELQQLPDNLLDGDDNE
jgi:Sec-independent protein translocase protein TatA